MLLFTGFTRHSGIIASTQQKTIPATLSQLHEMKSLVPVSEKILTEGDPDDFGRLLNHTWQLKRTLTNQISSEAIDIIYEKAMQSGALGGKILGAGGGGFMLLYVPEHNQENIRRQFTDFEFIPFGFEKSGSKIITHKKS